MDESLKQPVKGILFDLDGVFYVDDQLIPGAVGCLRRLRKRNIGCRFVTNTTTQSSRELEDKLVGLGIPCRRDELITAPVATANYLRRSGIQRCYFAVKPAVMADFDGFSHTDDQPEAVVVGDIGEAWSYSLLDRLFGFVVSGASLVAMHRNRYWQTSAGLHVDIGAFVAGLEYAASVEAVVTGKPAPAFFDAAIASLGVARAHTILVGDDVVSDIGGAQRAGLRAVLVQTGKFRQSLVDKSGIAPDWIIPSVANLEDCLPS